RHTERLLEHPRKISGILKSGVKGHGGNAEFRMLQQLLRPLQPQATDKLAGGKSRQGIQLAVQLALAEEHLPAKYFHGKIIIGQMAFDDLPGPADKSILGNRRTGRFFRCLSRQRIRVTCPLRTLRESGSPEVMPLKIPAQSQEFIDAD